MAWTDDIVKVLPPPQPPPGDEEVAVSFKLYRESDGYDEYVLKCACAGVEPIFTRSDFDEDIRALWI